MLNSSLAQLDQILSKGKFIGNRKGLGFKGEYSNSKTIFIKYDSMISSVVFSHILENRKLVTSSVAIENSAEIVVIEQKSGMCVMKCKSGARSNMGNRVYVATKGKLATTQTETKSVITTDSHRFRKSIALDFKLAARFHSFAKIGATGQKLVVYISTGKPQNLFQYGIFVVSRDTLINMLYYAKLFQKVFVRKSFLGSQPRKTPRLKIDLNKNFKKVWVSKSDLICLSLFTYLRACATNPWYFDSGCSRHMTDNKSILVNYKSMSDGLVTFSDGVQGKVFRNETLNIEGFPKFKKVMYVEGLKANLISIIQICDLGLNMYFHEKNNVFLTVQIIVC